MLFDYSFVIGGWCFVVDLGCCVDWLVCLMIVDLPYCLRTWMGMSFCLLTWRCLFAFCFGLLAVCV